MATKILNFADDFRVYNANSKIYSYSSTYVDGFKNMPSLTQRVRFNDNIQNVINASNHNFTKFLPLKVTEAGRRELNKSGGHYMVEPNFNYLSLQWENFFSPKSELDIPSVYTESEEKYNLSSHGRTIINRQKIEDYDKLLSNKLNIKKKDKLFFISKYYKPVLPLNLTKYLLKFANSSIDVSDGLIDDLSKMINTQNLSFHLFEKKIPISNKLSNLIKNQRLNKINLVSNGDDYQVLFTANVNKTRIIQNASKTTGIKITKIGKIVSGKDRSFIFDEKGKQIQAKSIGYIHQF